MPRVDATVTVDGIPLSHGYGVEIETPDEVMTFNPHGVARSFGPSQRIRYHLTRDTGWGYYQRVREIPEDAVIAIQYEYTTIIYDQYGRTNA